MSVRIKGTIYHGRDQHKEDRIDMEIHDAVDYLMLKYVTKGNKFQALPGKLTTELSRVAEKARRNG